MVERIAVVNNHILFAFGGWMFRYAVTLNPISITSGRLPPKDYSDVTQSGILLSLGRLLSQRNHLHLIAAFAKESRNRSELETVDCG